jgi:hypothetical protein
MAMETSIASVLVNIDIMVGKIPSFKPHARFSVEIG